MTVKLPFRLGNWTFLQRYCCKDLTYDGVWYIVPKTRRIFLSNRLGSFMRDMGRIPRSHHPFFPATASLAILFSCVLCVQASG